MDDTKIPEAGNGQPAKLDVTVKVFPVQEKEGSNLRRVRCHQPPCAGGQERDLCFHAPDQGQG